MALFADLNPTEHQLEIWDQRIKSIKAPLIHVIVNQEIERVVNAA